MRIPKTLYVIADGGRVRYIERVGPGRFNTFRKFVSVHLHEKAAELSPGKPGRVHESIGAARHAIAPKIDPRDKIEAEFIRIIAEDLRNDDMMAGFDNLVFIAPAKLQQAFQHALPDTIASKLAKCIDKDLTKVPDEDMYKHLPVMLVSEPAS